MRPSSKQTIARPFSSSLAGAHEILPPPPPPPPRGAKHGRVLFSSPLLFSPSKSSKVAANRVRESTREERSMFRIATESSSNRGRERERERAGRGLFSRFENNNKRWWWWWWSRRWCLFVSRQFSCQKWEKRRRRRRRRRQKKEQHFDDEKESDFRERKNVPPR